ncbi:Hypothetical protein FKW44_020277 [Caligus rogercresseyi]|uniref:Uncharacterized protein n=1 Tax=Caligus rogercresseyi TaxID=217165 RepID=A0A7T8GX25_CALRO|nr:Hypothetical protein FKW44_020277 [Caligus rogercresseyi]
MTGFILKKGRHPVQLRTLFRSKSHPKSWSELRRDSYLCCLHVRRFKAVVKSKEDM